MCWARAIDRALVAPGSSRTLGRVRSGLAVVMALRLAVGRWTELATLPADLYQPAFAVRLLAEVPPRGVLVAIQVVGILAAAIAARGGPWSRRAFGLAWLSLLVLGGLWSSTGKVMHNEVLLLLAAVPMLAAPTDLGGGTGATTSAGWPPRASLAVVAIGYLACGVQKLAHSGIGWVTSDNLRWVLRSGADGTRSPLPQLATAVADRAWLAHLVAAGALAIECSAPVLLARRATRTTFVVLVAALHLGVWLTLGLDYSGWVLTVAAVALPTAAIGVTSWSFEDRPPMDEAVGS